MLKSHGFLLLGTFATVYCVAPWVASKLLTLVDQSVMEHPERFAAIGFWATVASYYVLRRIFGEKLPRV